MPVHATKMFAVARFQLTGVMTNDHRVQMVPVAASAARAAQGDVDNNNQQQTYRVPVRAGPENTAVGRCKKKKRGALG